MSEQNEGRKVIATVQSEGTVLTFAFNNGNTHELDVTTLSPEVRARGEMHGFEQKLRDCYAGAKGDVAVAEGAFLKVLDTLKRGEWSGKREGSGPGEGSIDLLARAMVNAWAAKGKDMGFDQVLEMVKGKTKEERASIRSIESVAVELAKLKAKSTVVEGCEDL